MSFKDEKIEQRKLEHIEITLKENVESKSFITFNDVMFIHKALPEVDLDKIDTKVRFLKYTLNAPFIVSAITGGHPLSYKINKAIAEAINELKLGMGVGSQRAALKDPSLKYTFAIAREIASSRPIIANIGLAQLVKETNINQIIDIVNMIEADALAIHLNPAQEVFQVEGDTSFKGAIKAIERILNEINVPIIIKEVGTGLSKEVALQLAQIGIRYFDVAGTGGTNWILIELIRARKTGKKEIEEIGRNFITWGIPTPASIIEVFYSVPQAYIIGSGGIRTGLDIAKAIALGADLTAIAKPVLEKAINGAKEVVNLLSKLINELKITMLLCGCNYIHELYKAPISLSTSITNYLKYRGIDIKKYEKLRIVKSERLKVK